MQYEKKINVSQYKKNVNKQNKNHVFAKKNFTDTSAAISIRKVKIEAGETKVVELKHPNSINRNKLLLLEPRKHNIKIFYEQSVHKLEDHSDNIKIFIENKDSKTITLNKGMKIGNISQDFIIKKNRSDTKKNQKTIIYEVNNLNIQDVRKL